MSRSRKLRLLGTGILGTIALVASPQQPFALDPSFKTEIDRAYVSSVLPMPDGKVIASGLMRFPDELTDKRLVRLSANGLRDESFNNSGLGQGKLTAWVNDTFYVGTSQTVRRILPEGHQDPSFIEMNLGPYFSSGQGGDYHVFDDGRVLMSGVHLLNDAERGYVGDYCLCWFSNEGYLDTTRVHRKCSGSLDHFQALPGGKFIGSGSTSIYDDQPASNIFRFNADGSLDPSFQANVWWGSAYAFVPLPDGRLYAAGRFQVEGLADTLQLVRLMPDGSLDPTFNNQLDFDVIELTSFFNGALVRGLYMLPNGSLIVMGNFEQVAGQLRSCICGVDSSGNLLPDLCGGPGVGLFEYQGSTTGSVAAMAPAVDGSYYICGAYHGYDDGITNDTTQRMVSRLYGLDVGVEEAAVESMLMGIHPNPAIGWLSVSLDELPVVATLLIRDPLGREVQRYSLTSHNTTLSLQTMSDGIYLLELFSSGKRLAVQRVLVQH